MKKVLRSILVSATVLLMMGVFAGCMPYDKPEHAMIEPSETAFLIPLEGKTSEQGSFASEELLAKAKVSTKRIQIPHRWLQEGRLNGDGRYIPTMKLIVVDRKPVTREWTEINGTGTSNKNEGIVAESKESIGFMARMNCSAQIDEDQAVKFLYRYNNKSLSDVMDTEIRARIESKFVEECSKFTLEEILLNKENIMKSVRNDVEPYFKDRGITITVIGLKGELTYLNDKIQESIDEKFKSAQSLTTQRNENERIISKAKADAEAISIQASTIQSQIRMKELENQSKAIEKWDGKMPTYNGGANNILNIPIK